MANSKKKKDWQKRIDEAHQSLTAGSDKEDLFFSLIGNGYLPHQLPPPFQSSSLSTILKRKPKDFLKRIKENYFNLTVRSTTYNFARPKSLRRVLNVVHPVPHILLSMEVAAHWEELKELSHTSPFSLSKPIVDDDSYRALKHKDGWEPLPAQKMRIRVGGTSIVIADISRFFPSIYTHSIPWALHGKSKSKTNKFDSSLLGNRLDTHLRSGQDGQTLGIPIGPDTSFVISECILANIDNAIKDKLSSKGVKATRIVDDYEFSCHDLSTAEECLSAIQEALQAYELELNTLKSQILELPQPTQPHEFALLRRFDFGDTAKVSEKKILEYIDLAFECYRKHPKGILKFAIKKIPIALDTPLIDDFMCQSMILEPGAIEPTLSRLTQEPAYPWLVTSPKEYKKFAECFGKIIKKHAPLGHSSEVAWSIWGYMIINEKIPTDVVNAIYSMNDPVALLLALDARQKGLIPKHRLIKAVKKIISGDQPLHGKNWLIAYEAVQKGWAPSGFKSHVSKEPFFSLLKARGVEFYKLKDTDGYKEDMKNRVVDFGYGEGPEDDDDDDLPLPF